MIELRLAWWWLPRFDGVYDLHHNCQIFWDFAHQLFGKIICKLKKSIWYCLWKLFFCVSSRKRMGYLSFTSFFFIFHLQSNGCFSEWLRKSSNGSRDEAQNVPCPQCRATVHSVGKNHYLQNIEQVHFPSFSFSLWAIGPYYQLIVLLCRKLTDLFLFYCCRLYSKAFLH